MMIDGRRPDYSDEFIASMEAAMRNPKGSADYGRRAWWMSEGRAEAARQRGVDAADLAYQQTPQMARPAWSTSLARALIAPATVPRAAVLAVFVAGLLLGLVVSRDDVDAPAARRATPSRRRLRR